ncbi:of DNA damage checkpoint protein 1 [Seminavis robusta]|uniref:Of DNA damage checkpoint protein 1 n=1 Tax=Seminavis robusta TaxID=568900 RepID=A0A9N8HDB4_9STRA|nr:of DNA damage checkpoint protein 1 [Seminavis robusta]|eukprot:Sro419_g139150.1 of DNA damage checkpoint protein 1 (1576) ;mRNA; r:51014-56111
MCAPESEKMLHLAPTTDAKRCSVGDPSRGNHLKDTPLIPLETTFKPAAESSGTLDRDSTLQTKPVKDIQAIASGDGENPLEKSSKDTHKNGWTEEKEKTGSNSVERFNKGAWTAEERERLRIALLREPDIASVAKHVGTRRIRGIRLFARKTFPKLFEELSERTSDGSSSGQCISKSPQAVEAEPVAEKEAAERKAAAAAKAQAEKEAAERKAAKEAEAIANAKKEAADRRAAGEAVAKARAEKEAAERKAAAVAKAHAEKEAAERKAAKEAEAIARAKKEAATEGLRRLSKARAEKEAAERKAAAVAKAHAEKEAAERKAAKEAEAIAKAKKEAADRKAADEAEAKARAEKEAAERKAAAVAQAQAEKEAATKVQAEKEAAERKAAEEAEAIAKAKKEAANRKAAAKARADKEAAMKNAAEEAAAKARAEMEAFEQRAETIAKAKKELANRKAVDDAAAKASPQQAKAHARQCSAESEAVVTGTNPQTKEFGTKMGYLQEDFEPSEKSVIIGQGGSTETSGIRHLKSVIQSHLDEYRLQKTSTIKKVMNIIRESCPVGAFVKFENSRWQDAGEKAARTKVGAFFRDALHDSYKSNSKIKAGRSRTREQQVNAGRACESKVSISVADDSTGSTGTVLAGKNKRTESATSAKQMGAQSDAKDEKQKAADSTKLNKGGNPKPITDDSIGSTGTASSGKDNSEESSTSRRGEQMSEESDADDEQPKAALAKSKKGRKSVKVPEQDPEMDVVKGKTANLKPKKQSATKSPSKVKLGLKVVAVAEPDNWIQPVRHGPGLSSPGSTASHDPTAAGRQRRALKRGQKQPLSPQGDTTNHSTEEQQPKISAPLDGNTPGAKNSTCKPQSEKAGAERAAEEETKEATKSIKQPCCAKAPEHEEDQEEGSLVNTSKSSRKRKATKGATAQQEPKRTKGEVQEVRVMTSNVTLTKAQERMLEKLGGMFVEDVSEAQWATHVIVVNPKDKKSTVKRTTKLMVGMCNSAIVGLDWLTESFKAKEFLPAKGYYITDKAAEALYGFSMQTSLERAEKLRSNEKNVLSGWSVFLCHGVAGNMSPPEEEWGYLVEGAGGTFISSMSQKTVSGIDLRNLVIITSDPEQKTQTKSNLIRFALENGAKQVTTSKFFSFIMNQKMDFDTTASKSDATNRKMRPQDATQAESVVLTTDGGGARQANVDDKTGSTRTATGGKNKRTESVTSAKKLVADSDTGHEKQKAESSKPRKGRKRNSISDDNTGSTGTVAGGQDKSTERVTDSAKDNTTARAQTTVKLSTTGKSNARKRMHETTAKPQQPNKRKSRRFKKHDVVNLLTNAHVAKLCEPQSQKFQTEVAPDLLAQIMEELQKPRSDNDKEEKGLKKNISSSANDSSSEDEDCVFQDDPIEEPEYFLSTKGGGYFKGRLMDDTSYDCFHGNCPDGFDVNKESENRGGVVFNSSNSEDVITTTQRCERSVCFFVMKGSREVVVYLAPPSASVEKQLEKCRDKDRSTSHTQANQNFKFNPFEMSEEQLVGWYRVAVPVGHVIIIPVGWFFCMKTTPRAVGIEVKVQVLDKIRGCGMWDPVGYCLRDEP